jgi:hypothetical protein
MYILGVDTLIDFSIPIFIDTLDNNNAYASLYERTCFYWRVRAYDLAGNQGAWSEPDSFGVDLTVPLIESTTVWMDTIYPGPFPIDCKVTDNTGIDSVFLYYLRCEDTTWHCLAMAEQSGWFSGEVPEVTLLLDTVKYYIKAFDISEPSNFNADPPGAPSYYYQFLIDRTPYVDETGVALLDAFKISVSSPARDVIIFNITSRLNADAYLKIHDVAGRCVAKFRIKNEERLIQSIKYTASAGVYFYMLDCGDQHLKGKVILLK